MKVGLDTSVVLRLLVGEPADLARVAVEYLIQIQQKGGCAVVSDLVVAETYFALQYHYKTPKAEALALLRQFLTSHGIENSGVAARVMATPHLESAKPGFVDRIVIQQYLEKTDAVATFERASRKLPKILVLEP